MAKRMIQVCLTPKLFNLYSDKKSIMVVVDGLSNLLNVLLKIEKIIPVSKVEEALEFKSYNGIIF